MAHFDNYNPRCECRRKFISSCLHYTRACDNLSEYTKGWGIVETQYYNFDIIMSLLPDEGYVIDDEINFLRTYQTSFQSLDRLILRQRRLYTCRITMIEGDYKGCVAAVIREIRPFYPPLITRANYPAR